MSIYQSEFPITDDILHFNHAGIAPWPQRTVRAIREFADENAQSGSLCCATWNKRLAELRRQCAQLLGTDSPDEIAFTKNTSEGLSLVAGGLDWKSGENIIVNSMEFPSNRIVWEVYAQRCGVELRLVPASDMPLEDAMIARIDKKTRLLAASSVQYATGYRMDLNKLGQACRTHRVLFCIDAIQSLGAIPFRVNDCCADFVCADGHKWLLSPEGTGLFYCRKKHLDTLRLNQYGWHMVKNAGYYDRTDWRPAPSASRFECGSMNHLGLFGLAASLELLAEVGSENIYRKIMMNISYLIENVDKKLFDVLTPEAHEKRAGILTLQARHADNDALYRHLRSKRVICAQRAGGIRLSPHFYTDQESLQSLIEHLHRGAERCSMKSQQS